MLVKLVTFLLSKKKLSPNDRVVLTNAILDRLGALPINDIIVLNADSSLVINGQRVDLEKARILRESARAVLSSTAMKLVNDQVKFTAITTGVHKANNEWEMLFGKSAIWYGQQQERYLKILSGVDTID